MSVLAERISDDVPEIDYDSLLTEDDQPVDNIFSAKQQRLLVESLYSSWHPEQTFFADANVGMYNSPYQPPIVPDMFLSLDVQMEDDLWQKRNRCYFVWKFGKPPEVAIEIVSSREGGETGKKFKKYAQIGVWYYCILDPQLFVQDTILRVYQLSLGRYVVKEDAYLDQVNLGLTLWDGVFEGIQAQWLRWCDTDGKLLLTAEESRVQERQRADREHQRAERLAAQLRALGVDPDNGGRAMTMRSANAWL